MDCKDKDRFIRMAEDYDQMAPLLVPMYEFLQDEMIRIAGVAAYTAPRIVDLGAGSGRLLEKVLTAAPDARCWWVDSSSAFEAVARRRLARFEGRVTYVLSPLESDWMPTIGRPVDVVLSMSAIHHLERSEKRALYAACSDLLAPGGWLLNTDEMQGTDRAAYRESLLYWARYIDAQMAHVPAELREHTARWRGHFENWKRRNIDGFDTPKTKGDDLHEPFTDQAGWLREIGFTNADVFVKYHLWCMIGGQKPTN